MIFEIWAWRVAFVISAIILILAVVKAWRSLR